MSAMDPVLQAARDAARGVAPDFEPQRFVARSVKTHVVQGTIGGVSVVAKVLSNSQPYWRWYLGREIALYRAFERRPPPIAVPRFIAADAERGVLLLQETRGRHLARGRAAAARCDAATVERLAADLLRLAAWDAFPDESTLQSAGAPPGYRGGQSRPLPDPRATVPWLEACVARWSERGLLRPRLTAAALERLSAPLELRFAHGDLLLRNVFQVDERLVYFDWEFAGAYLFGWDLGLLWVGLQGAPRAALERIIDGLAHARRAQTRLAALLATVRELEVRRVSLRQGAEHPLVQRLLDDVALAGRRLSGVL